MTLQEQQDVRQAISDFRGYLKELRNNPTERRIAYIRQEAIICEDLMNYCNNSDATLSRLLTEVFQLTNGDVMGINQQVKEFREFANSLDSGYLKEWKAGSMLMELETLPMITDDFGRCLNWVQDCLKMEGFSDRACVIVTDYLRALDLTLERKEYEERQRMALL